MNNSQEHKPDSHHVPQDIHLQILSAEENKNSTTGKTFPNFNTRENFIPPSFRSPNAKHGIPHMPTPTERNISFSDIISPHNVQTVVNMSLEKELENNVRKSLNTMSDRSNIFEQSSIHKEESNKQENPSAFDMKEQDSLLNDNTPNNNQAKGQPNKRICILCHNSREVQTAIVGNKPSKNSEQTGEYDLIYPCLCNIKAHRECLKAYLLMKKIVNCERCKTSYAVSGKTMKEIRLPKGNVIAMTIVTILCIAISIAGLALVVTSFANSQTPIVAAGVVLILVGILGIAYLTWRKYFSKKVVDLAVHCKQTEIARHRDRPEYTLVKFVEQEEKKSSRILKKAKKLLDLMDVLEFETFVKMTTPRTDNKHEKQRKGSSNLLLSDQTKQKVDDEEESLKKAIKEIFIVPTEIKVTLEKSENTIPDNHSNVNEYSKIRSAAIPHVRIAASNPSKHIDPSAQSKEQEQSSRPEMRRIMITGSQSERRHIDSTKKPRPARLVKMPLKETTQSAYSVENPQGLTTREKTDYPYFTSDEGYPKADLKEIESKKLEQE